MSWGVHGRFNAQEAVSGANAPWTLMDRVITEDKVALRVDQVRKLVVRAAVGKSGMEEEQFRAELEVGGGGWCVCTILGDSYCCC